MKILILKVLSVFGGYLYNLNNMYFNKLLDSTDYEIASYVKKYLLENSKYTIKLHVGCDSQNISSHTNYATTRKN